MTLTSNAHRKRSLVPLVFLACFAFIYLVDVSGLHSAQLRDRNAFVLGATIDMTVVIPAIYYFLIARPRRWPIATLAGVFFICFCVASIMMPPGSRGYLRPVGMTLFPALEALVAGLLFVKVRRAIASAGQVDEDQYDFPDKVRFALLESVGNNILTEVILTEVSAIYFALFSWRTKPRRRKAALQFSYHQTAGYEAVLIGFILLLVIEALIAHLLLHRYAPPLAWISALLTGYFIIWILGDYQAMRLRPIAISSDQLCLRLGLRWRADVPLENISALKRIADGSAMTRNRKLLKFVLIGDPQFVILLKSPLTAAGPFGLKRTFNAASVAVDDRENFERELLSRLRPLDV